MTSPVYWHPYIYRVVMRFLYGKHFTARYKAIFDIIPYNARVLEVCAGDGYLYSYFLKKKQVIYSGLDINPVFVAKAKKNGLSFFLHDLTKDPIPSSDYIIIQASLYQFMPYENVIIKKLLEAARGVLIIAEPVKNLTNSNNIFISLLAKYSANPGKNHAVRRFNKDTLMTFFKQFTEFKEMRMIEGEREMIGIFCK